MSRAKWKGPYINFKNIKQFKTLNKKKSIITISRNSSIVPQFLGYTFKVHTGKLFIEIIITKDMIGHKFGEFVETRKLFTFKKKKKKR